MKVLLIQTFHYPRGGDCTYTFSLADLLRGHGHEVSYFAMRHPLNVASEQERYFVDYIDYVEMSQQKTPWNAARVLSRSIYSLSARRQLSALLRDIRPDVAHLQNIHAHLTPSVLHALRDVGIPAVWTLHDYKLICPNTHLLSHGAICEACKGNRFFECTVRRCKKNSRAASLVATLEATAHRFLGIPQLAYRFVAPSRFLRDKFIEFGWGADKLVHIRNFLRPELLDDVGAVDDNYVLYLGQLEPWKGVTTLLDACGRLPRVQLVVAGRGTQRDALEAKARAMNHPGITFAGHLDGTQLRQLLRGASVVVVPSEWYENCPYSVMEAMASGKAVIATTLGGLPELTRHEETGLLVEPGNPESLAAALDRLMSDSALRRQLGGAARQRAVDEFAPERHYERISELYNAARRSVGGTTE